MWYRWISYRYYRNNANHRTIVLPFYYIPMQTTLNIYNNLIELKNETEKEFYELADESYNPNNYWYSNGEEMIENAETGDEHENAIYDQGFIMWMQRILSWMRKELSMLDGYKTEDVMLP